MKKIKILCIITRPIYGGASKGALSIFERLNKNKFEYSIITGGKKISREDLSYEITQKGIDLIFIPELIRNIHPLKDLITFIKLYYLIKKIKPDIVHTYTSKAGVLGRLSAKLAKVPVIIHNPCGSIFEPIYISPLSFFFFILIEKFMARFTDKIIAQSEDEKNDYLSRRIAKEEKFITIVNGIDLKEFYDVKINPQEIKKELDIPYFAKVIGNISRLSYEKGHFTLLEAFLQIYNNFSNIYLVIVGEGGLRQKIEKEIKKLGIEKKTILTGLRKDIPQILSIMDIFVHPSLCDTFPIAIIEAMAAGKPIIATKVGGIPEIIDDKKSGILIAPYDHLALSQAIISLLNDSNQREELGHQAKIRSQMFDINNKVQKIEDLYLTIFEEKLRCGKM